MNPTSSLVLAMLIGAGCSESLEPPAGASANSGEDAKPQAASDAGSTSRDADPEVGDGGSADAGQEDGSAPTGRLAICDLPTVTALLDDHAAYEDCGTLPHTSTSAEDAAATACMANAFTNQRPFRVVFTTQGTDAYVTTAYLAFATGGKLKVYAINSSTGIGPSTDWVECGLVIKNDCDGNMRKCSLCYSSSTGCVCNPGTPGTPIDYRCDS